MLDPAPLLKILVLCLRYLLTFLALQKEIDPRETALFDPYLLNL